LSLGGSKIGPLLIRDCRGPLLSFAPLLIAILSIDMLYHRNAGHGALKAIQRSHCAFI